jgi:type IV secretory pathway protease TraF
MPGLLRDLAVGRSWRSRLARGAAVLALGGAWVAPTFGLCPPLALYNTTESVAPGLYLYAHDARSVAPTRGDYYCCVTQVC